MKSWLHGYVDRLEPAPDPRWTISDEDWRGPLGVDPGWRPGNHSAPASAALSAALIG